MKKYVVVVAFLACSCKSITYNDVNQEIKPNENIRRSLMLVLLIMLVRGLAVEVGCKRLL